MGIGFLNIGNFVHVEICLIALLNNMSELEEDHFQSRGRVQKLKRPLEGESTDPSIAVLVDSAGQPKLKQLSRSWGGRPRDLEPENALLEAFSGLLKVHTANLQSKLDKIQENSVRLEEEVKFLKYLLTGAKFALGNNDEQLVLQSQSPQSQDSASQPPTIEPVSEVNLEETEPSGPPALMNDMKKNKKKRN